MIRTNISLHQEQHDLIKTRCDETGCSLSWIIREALDEYFKDKPKNKNAYKFIPKSQSVPKEITEKINNVLENKSRLCKVCGSVLNQYGECNNRLLHKK